MTKTGIKKLFSIIIVIAVVFSLTACGNEKAESAATQISQEVPSEEGKLPWSEEDAKQPSDYTMEEFNALSGEEQIKFQQEFESHEEFDEWLQDAAAQEDSYLPWDKEGAKQPPEYTLEEFNALSGEEQIKFQQYFDSIDDFNEWLKMAENSQLVMPWDKEGAKSPSDYTWEEFLALGKEEQIMFQRSFDTKDGFEKWLEANES